MYRPASAPQSYRTLSRQHAAHVKKHAPFSATSSPRPQPFENCSHVFGTNYLKLMWEQKLQQPQGQDRPATTTTHSCCHYTNRVPTKVDDNRDGGRFLCVVSVRAAVPTVRRKAHAVERASSTRIRSEHGQHPRRVGRGHHSQFRVDYRGGVHPVWGKPGIIIVYSHQISSYVCCNNALSQVLLRPKTKMTVWVFIPSPYTSEQTS